MWQNTRVAVLSLNVTSPGLIPLDQKVNCLQMEPNLPLQYYNEYSGIRL